MLHTCFASHFLRSIAVAAIAVGVCWGLQAKAENSSQLALSYFEACQILAEQRTTYDVSIHVEQSNYVDGLAVPIGVMDWRVRVDEEDEFGCFLYTQRTLPVTDGLQGNLDSWKIQSGLVIVGNDGVTENIVGERKYSRRFPDFKSSMSKATFPRVQCFGLDRFSSIVMIEPMQVMERVRAPFAKAESILVDSLPYQNENAVLVQAKINSVRLNIEETHKWWFSSPEVRPLAHEITQRRTGFEPRRIYRQELVYREQGTYGNVLASLRDVAEIHLTFSSPKGETSTLAEQVTEITFQWHDVTGSEQNRQFKIDTVTLSDVDRLLKEVSVQP